MNQAHLHMVLNHFPIIGLIFGIGVLFYGIIKKHSILINTAYVIFMSCPEIAIHKLHRYGKPSRKSLC